MFVDSALSQPGKINYAICNSKQLEPQKIITTVTSAQ